MEGILFTCDGGRDCLRQPNSLTFAMPSAYTQARIRGWNEAVHPNRRHLLPTGR